MRLEVQLLGRGSIRVDDSSPVVAWPRPAARRLVALLALAPAHRRTRDELADLLAGHLPPDRAARSISKALSQARSVLGRDVLDADRTAVWIADGVDVTCDLADLRDTLRALLAASASAERDAAIIDQIAAVGDLVVADDPYEEWAVEACDEVSRLVDRARLLRARSAGTVAAWQAVADRDPANEEAALALAAAAVRRDDRDAVVRSLSRCRSAVEALGLVPSAVFERQAATFLTSAPAGPGGRVHGRHAELGRVVAALRSESSVLVAGSAGIGKTALVTVAAATLQAEGWHVGAGTAVPDDRFAPMAALRAAMRGVLDRADPLARRLVDVSGGDGGADAAELARLADEIRSALPPRTLLVVDDVQWADPAMQRLLGRLASTPGACPVLLLAGRSDEPDAPLPEFPSHVLVQALGPITDDAAREIVHDEVPGADPAVAHDVIRRGRGNPFFLVELARATTVTGGEDAVSVPEAVVALLRRRLDPLAVPVRRLLEGLALLGEDAAYDVLAAAGLDLGPDGAHLDELLTRRLVREHASGPRLIHPLLRDAVLSETNAMRRAAVRVELAAGLEQVAVGTDAVGRILAAAHHRVAAWLESRLPELAQGAAAAGFVAGRKAEALFAHEAAEQLLRGGIEAFEFLPAEDRVPLVGDATDAWIELGHLLGNRGDMAGAEDAYRTALGLAPDDRLRARAWRAIAYIPYRKGELQAAESLYRIGLGALGSDAMAAALLEIELGWVLHRTGRLQEAVDVLAGPAVVAEEAGEWSLAARALDRLGVALEGVGRLDDALATLDRALAASRRTGNARMRAVVQMHLAAALRAGGRAREALTHARESARLSEDIGDPYNRSVVHWVTAEVLEDLGDLAGALGERDAEVALLTRIGNDFNRAGAEAHRAALLHRLGLVAESQRAEEEARAAATRAGGGHLTERIERRLRAVTALPAT